MESITYEARLNLAIEAIKNDENLSIRTAAKIYNVSYTTLIQRRSGRPSVTDLRVTGGGIDKGTCGLACLAA
jgi:hypothetical protein